MVDALQVYRQHNIGSAGWAPQLLVDLVNFFLSYLGMLIALVEDTLGEKDWLLLNLCDLLSAWTFAEHIIILIVFLLQFASLIVETLESHLVLASQINNPDHLLALTLSVLVGNASILFGSSLLLAIIH